MPDSGLDVAKSVLLQSTPDDRRSSVLHLAARRDVVDLEPTIKALRDQLDVDGGYGAGADLHEKAAQMMPDVLQLMRLRSSRAICCGAASYPALVRLLFAPGRSRPLMEKLARLLGQD
jgi:hypothetical protein